MAPIYTKQFYLGGVAPNSFQDLYTVELGTVAVLRDIELVQGAAGAALAIYAEGGAIILLQTTAVGPYAFARWEGRVALGAGNSFRAYNYAATPATIAVTGYVFNA